ncbi:MAG: tRNA (cytidine(34)-2'-O)-methyltransferase [Alphaproteobacteria bacterium]|nr:tRNA (cytidine(34)-2'-O)-methyltransferase [Alphaproteobacteria bacterium]
MRIALFQPDIPQNAGAILRLAACLGVGVDIIGPTGFVLSDTKVKRAGLDYAATAALASHANWSAFCAALGPDNRLVLFTTRGETDYRDAAYRSGDVLMFGRESAGVPDFVHDAAALRLRIPLADGMRSLNVATAAAMALGEGLRQTCSFPGDAPLSSSGPPRPAASTPWQEQEGESEP